MASKPATTLLTARDTDILTALDRCLLTLDQLLKLSQTFSRPFTTYRRAHERLQQISDSGWVRRAQYATASRGAVNYYLLTRLGYQILHGADAVAPTKRYFSPVGIANQQHTRSLADFIVHTAVGAHLAAATLTSFYRENTLRLDVRDQTLWPDCAFQLLDANGQELSFVVELDNSTERIRSPKELDSWERKIRFYDEYQYASGRRFRVLVVATRSQERMKHILTASADLIRNPQRSLFYGITLAQYLGEPHGVTSPCFTDHIGRSVALLPRQRFAPASSALRQSPRYQAAPSQVEPSHLEPSLC